MSSTNNSDSGGNTTPPDDVVTPQHREMYLDTIVAACEETNRTARPQRSEEERQKERLEANRRSAKVSRHRKKIVFEDLKRTVARLGDENAMLRRMNESLRQEMESLKGVFLGLHRTASTAPSADRVDFREPPPKRLKSTNAGAVAGFAISHNAEACVASTMSAGGNTGAPVPFPPSLPNIQPTVPTQPSMQQPFSSLTAEQLAFLVALQQQQQHFSCPTIGTEGASTPREAVDAGRPSVASSQEFNSVLGLPAAAPTPSTVASAPQVQMPTDGSGASPGAFVRASLQDQILLELLRRSQEAAAGYAQQSSGGQQPWNGSIQDKQKEG